MNIFTTYEKQAEKPQTQNENNNINELVKNLTGIPQICLSEYFKAAN